MPARIQEALVGRFLEALLQNPNGTPYDLTGQTLVELRLQFYGLTTVTRNMSSGVSIVGPATNGQVRYTWAAGDIPNVSRVEPFRYQWYIEKGAGEKVPFPVLEGLVRPNL
jgi:hypothetical protein